MTSKIWEFSAADNWFFGSGNPMNAGESGWRESQFPPTGLTLQGAIRTAVLYFTGADIENFKKGLDCLPENGGSLLAEIGCAKSLGALDLAGPFLSRNNELLFPVPLDLLYKAKHAREINAPAYVFLKPATTSVECDLGHVHLPVMNSSGYKVLENHYLGYADMLKALKGEGDGLKPIPLFSDEANPSRKHCESLADKEPKVGLARDNQTRLNKDSMLFSISSVRPRAGLSLKSRVRGISPAHTPPPSGFLQQLGGEGKLAEINITDCRADNFQIPEKQLKIVDKKLRFKLVFIQPALMPVAGWLPENFDSEPTEAGWVGELNHSPVTIVSACIGKSLKFGGWDLEKSESKPHQAFIPAGSVYFCEAEKQYLPQIEKLHDSKLGDKQQLGFGHVLLGLW